MIHYAAGILPVTWHRGELLFLVGQDLRDRSWSDFGGKCERVDRGDALNTACREFYEETCGCVVDHRALRARLNSSTCLALRGRTQNGHPYWMFVAEVPYQPHLRGAYRKVLAFLRHRNLCKACVEKTDVQWVTWKQLRGASLVKRSVFAATLEAHAATLERLASGEDAWPALCAELAHSHAGAAHCGGGGGADFHKGGSPQASGSLPALGLGTSPPECAQAPTGPGPGPGLGPPGDSSSTTTPGA